MPPVSIYAQHIKTTYPELEIQSIRLLTDDGQFNDIVVVNEEYVFRFPRTAQVAAHYAQQAHLLRFLYDKVSLPVPLPRFSSLPGVPWQEQFMGYRRIPGEPLYRNVITTLDDDTQHAIAGQLATFLRSLHRLTARDLPVTLPMRDQVHDWDMVYHDIKESLFPVMRRDARFLVQAQFETYFRYPDLQTFAPVVRHGDFGGSNILFDRQRGQVSGVLDFESLAVGDPALDAASLSTYGERFFALCLPVYPELQAMRERARFYRTTFALQEALHGIRTGDVDAFRNGMADYV